MPKRGTTAEHIEEKVFSSKKINKSLKTIYKFFSKAPSNQLLVFLLLIASFLIGVLVTKVYDLQNAQSANQANAQA